MKTHTASLTLIAMLLTMALFATPATAADDGAADDGTAGDGTGGNGTGGAGMPGGGAASGNGSMAGAMPPAGGGPGALSLTNVVIEDILFSDDEPGYDDVVTITALARNNGTATVEGVTIAFFVDNKEFARVENVTVPLGGKVNVSVEWTAEEYTHTIAVMRLVDEVPLQNTMYMEELYVEPEPIGDTASLVGALLVLMVITGVAVMVPAVYEKMRNGKGQTTARK